MKLTIILLILLCSCSDRLHQKPVKTKAVRSERPKTDLVIMFTVLGLVVIWCNEEGFYKHVK